VTFYEIRRNDIMKMDAHWAVDQAESFVEALRTKFSPKATARNNCCIATGQASMCHPRERGDPAVGHDEATT
jgi:hypothetical protein